MRPIIILALIFGLASCYRGNDSYGLEIKFNAFVSSMQQCTVKAETNLMRPSGIMDVWMTNRYYLTPVLENLYPPIEQSSGMKGLYTENYTINLTGAYVTYSYNSKVKFSKNLKAALDKEYFFPTSGIIEPSGKRGDIIMVIPPEIGQLFQEQIKKFGMSAGFQILVNVVYEGYLQDGTMVKSNVFTYPVEICYQCLILQLTNNCHDLSKAQDMKLPCFIGQDDGVDCRYLYLKNFDVPEPKF